MQFPWQSPASVTLYGGGETAQGAREAPHTLWDLLVVLRALTGPPFEPLETVDMKFVSLKATLLLALVQQSALVTCKPCPSAHRAFSSRWLGTKWLCDRMLLIHLRWWQP